MAIFTTSEANASTIVRMEQKKIDGTHQCWVFGITDAHNNYIDWIDSTLSASATKTEVKARILEYLTGAGDFDGVEKRPAPPVIAFEEVTDKGRGETVG
tara:strand:+ start:2029 stop:2325 length:297 start_codon:yes stop_codon:yes gene_type:complete